MITFWMLRCTKKRGYPVDMASTTFASPSAQPILSFQVGRDTDSACGSDGMGVPTTALPGGEDNKSSMAVMLKLRVRLKSSSTALATQRYGPGTTPINLRLTAGMMLAIFIGKVFSRIDQWSNWRFTDQKTLTTKLGNQIIRILNETRSTSALTPLALLPRDTINIVPNRNARVTLVLVLCAKLFTSNIHLLFSIWPCVYVLQLARLTVGDEYWWCRSVQRTAGAHFLILPRTWFHTEWTMCTMLGHIVNRVR